MDDVRTLARVHWLHRDMGKARRLLRVSGPYLVGLVYLCSTNSTAPVTAVQIREILAFTKDLSGEPRFTRVWNRLGDETRTEVTKRYEAGETTTVLAANYGVAKSTIISILRAKRVVVRRRPLAPEQVSEAARLYETGLSLSKVAKQLQVIQETMRVAIIASGTTLRPPTGQRSSVSGRE